MSPELIRKLAAELQRSEQTRVQISHFSKRFPDMTVADGYAISRAWVQMKIAEGRVACGHKIGLTSRAMQISSQIDEPDYGTLLDDMFFEPGEIPSARFIAPRVEVKEEGRAQPVPGDMSGGGCPSSPGRGAATTNAGANQWVP